jgi:outer membrane protein assembly factor BamB
MWKYRCGISANSHPAIGADGTIYIIGGSKGVEAVSPDGKKIWSVTYGNPCVPVIARDGTVYFDSLVGLVFGVNIDEKLIWRPNYGLIGFKLPPALSPGSTLYYINTKSDVWAFTPRDSDKSLRDLETIRPGMLTTRILPGFVPRDDAHQNGSPIVTRDDSILVPRHNFLQSITPNGEPGWNVDATSGTLGQAALGEDGTIYVADDRNVLYAFDRTGEKKWMFDAGVVGSPVVDTQAVIYFTDGAGLYALAPDGSLTWRIQSPAHDAFHTSPTLAADGIIYIGGNTGLFAYYQDGSLRWSLIKYGAGSAPTIAPDGTIYYTCWAGYLCAVRDEGSPLMRSSWPKQFHDQANTSYVSALTD